LKYAHRAKSIENVVIKNEDVNERIIRELKEEIELLRQQLSNSTPTQTQHHHQEEESKDDSNETMLKDKIKELEDSLLLSHSKNTTIKTQQEKDLENEQFHKERLENYNATLQQLFVNLRDEKSSLLKNQYKLQSDNQTLEKKKGGLEKKIKKLKLDLNEKLKSYEELSTQFEDDATLDLIQKDQLENEIESLVSSIEEIRQLLISKRQILEVIDTKFSSNHSELEDISIQLASNSLILAEKSELLLSSSS